jgi:hypothetical protein
MHQKMGTVKRHLVKMLIRPSSGACMIALACVIAVSPTRGSHDHREQIAQM